MSGTRRGAGLGTPLGGSKAKRRTRARGRAIALWRGRDLLDPAGAARAGGYDLYILWSGHTKSNPFLMCGNSLSFLTRGRFSASDGELHAP